MTVFFNANTSGLVDPKNAPTPTWGAAGRVQGVIGEYTLAAALTLNQVIPMVPIPAGARILGGRLSCTDLDTGGSPAIVLAVGDGGDDDRFLTGSTIGQAGGDAEFNLHASHAYQYTSGDTIDVKVTTAPATGATSGTICLSVLYVFDPE